MGEGDWPWFGVLFGDEWDKKGKWFQDLATFISVSNKSSKSFIIQFVENSPVNWSWKVSTYQFYVSKIDYFMGIILKSKSLNLGNSEFLLSCRKTDRKCPSTAFTSLIAIQKA